MSSNLCKHYCPSQGTHCLYYILKIHLNHFALYFWLYDLQLIDCVRCDMPVSSSELCVFMEFCSADIVNASLQTIVCLFIFSETSLQ